MKSRIVAALAIVVVIAGLFAASKARAPKAPPPTTQEIWQQEGIPVDTARVIVGDIDQTVEVTGNIAADMDSTLSPKIMGRVARFNYREGDAVPKGAAVVVLDQDDAQSALQAATAALNSAKARESQAMTNATVTKTQTDAAIEQAKAGVDQAQARLAVVKNPTRSQERMVAENNVESAKANLDNADANYKRHQQLLKDGAISQSAFDLVETQYKIAQTQHKSAKQQLSLITEGGRSEDVQAAEAAVTTAKQQLIQAKANASQNLLRREDIKSARATVNQAAAMVAQAREQLANTVLRAPFAGYVASRLVEPGQSVNPGTPVARIVNPKTVYFKGDLSETELARVGAGNDVRVTIDALPELAFAGKVDSVLPAGSESSRNFGVRIRILERVGFVKPGMFARGRIVTGLSRGALLIPIEAVEERRGTKMVFTIDEQKSKPDKDGKSKTIFIAKRHDIVVVNENRDFVQATIQDGLRPGDQVVTKGRQNLLDRSKVELSSGRGSAR